MPGRHRADGPPDGYDTAEHDFANDGTAMVYRQLKVEALRTWLWNHYVTAAELQTHIDNDDRHILNRICRDVGVNPPSKGSPTWPLVVDDLKAKEAWATLNPRDPRARPASERPVYLPTTTSGTR